MPVIVHNGLDYDYNFIIKSLSNKSERKFECIGENTGK